MKKSNIMIVILLFYVALAYFAPFLFGQSFLNPMTTNNSLLLYLLVFFVLFIITLYFKLEDKQITTKELSLIAIYSTFTAIARVPFNVIPNFTPCDFLIFCAGYVFGPLIGFIIGGNTAIISNLFLGQGPWTIYQIVAWGLVGVTGGLLNPKHNQIPNRFFIAIVGFIWGFVYGWITNIWFWLLNPPISLTTFIATNILSFPFDLLHAIASFIFLFAFGIPTINILYRYRQRFVINRVELPIVQELG